MVLYGKNSIKERLKADPKSIHKVFVRDNFSSSLIEELIAKSNIPLVKTSSKKLDSIKRAKDHQGIVAQVDDFSYASFDDLIDPGCEERPVILFLDRIYDPQNLGVIIRTASCFGGISVVIPKHKACSVNETVLHVASGGENYLKVAEVVNLSTAIIAAKKSGYWIVGADTSSESEDINKIELPFPLGLVLGSEGVGVRYGVGKHLDLKAHIPMPGAELSFNVSMACAIFCHEIVKARSKDARY